MARLAFPTDHEMLAGTMLSAPAKAETIVDEAPTDPSLFILAMESDNPADHQDQRG